MYQLLDKGCGVNNFLVALKKTCLKDYDAKNLRH
jgi:hypothetical protein